MRYVWSDTTRANFLQTSHRSRYLLCDGLINPPADHTPLYAIQYATSAKFAVFVTSGESIIVFAATSKFYLGTRSALGDAIGLWPKNKRRASGMDTHARLATVPYLWDEEEESQCLPGSGGGNADINNPLQEFQVPDLDTLYHTITQLCGVGGISSTFTAAALRLTIPRPSAPEAGIPLGVPYGLSEPTTTMVLDSSNPASRQGGRLGRGGRAGPKQAASRKRTIDEKNDDDETVKSRRRRL